MKDGLHFFGGGSFGDYACYPFWMLSHRRTVSVGGNADCLRDYAVAEEVVKHCALELLPDEVKLTLSDDGKMITSSNKIQDDGGRFFRYPPFDDQADDIKANVVRRSEPREENPMDWIADIV